MTDAWTRHDPTDDAAFYAFPRFVTHLGDGAIAALTGVYRRVLPPDEPVLDLMSSWVSHLPADARLGPVSGVGMNEAELAANPVLADHVVHDLNASPRLPYADGRFGAVVCAVSVQYLTRPLEVFAEVRRVLRPAGVCVVSFSNRCFPTKAVRAWLGSADRDHVALVRAYLERGGLTGVVEEAPPTGDDPLWVVRGHRPVAPRA